MRPTGPELLGPPLPVHARHGRRPFYALALDLRHIAPSAWQRAVLAEGSLAVAVVLVLADVSSAWLLLVLPLSVAAVVKAHDVVSGLLTRPIPTEAPRHAASQDHQKDRSTSGPLS